MIVPDGQPRTKPRAMNYALDFCEGDIIGILDAEDAPDPDQITQVARRFRQAPPDVVCLQGYLDYYNPRQNWLSRCFTIEYAMVPAHPAGHGAARPRHPAGGDDALFPARRAGTARRVGLPTT